MDSEQWELLVEIDGTLQAEILRGLLEAQGIRVLLSREGAGEALGIQIGRLGRTQVLVPTSQLVPGQQVLDAYYAGEFSEPSGPEIPSLEDDELFMS